MPNEYTTKIQPCVLRVVLLAWLQPIRGCEDADKSNRQAVADLDQAQQSWDWAGINWLVAGYIGKESSKVIKSIL